MDCSIEQFREIVKKCIIPYFNRIDLEDLGKEMFRMFTEQGFPPDNFLSELEKYYKFTNEEKVYILYNYNNYFTQHKIKSGIGEKRFKDLQDFNRGILIKVYKTGEAGIY
jgi:hypothetical protein